MHGIACASIFALLLFPWCQAGEFSGKSGVFTWHIGLIHCISFDRILKFDAITLTIFHARTEVRIHWLALAATAAILVLAITSFARVFRRLFPKEH